MIALIIMTAMILNATLGQLPLYPQYAGSRSSPVSIQQTYKTVATVTADATDWAADTSYWHNIDDTFVQIPVEWSYVSLCFVGFGDGDGVGSPDGATFSYKIYTCNQYGGAQLICDGAGTIGAQQLSINPATGAVLNSGSESVNYCYCDTLTEGSVYVSRDIGYSDNSGNDGVAELHFDRYSAVGISCIITSMTAQPVTSVTAYVTGFNN